MKKKIIATLLILLIFTGLQSGGGFVGNGSQVYAKAATISKTSLQKPSAYIANKFRNSVVLCINKVKGATTYKVYRAASKNGKYKCIGKTKSNVFIDKIKNSDSYYYKVKAFGKVDGSTVSSKRSKATKVDSVKPKITTKVPSKVEAKTKVNVPSKVEAKTKVNAPSSSKTSTNQSYADEVLKLINQERAKAGLKALTTIASLQNAADKRATEITKSFSHTRPDGRSFTTVLGEYSVSYSAAGENIAYGQKTPNEVMTGWMNSPGHRANILGSQFGKVGVGVYKAANGSYYWTQVFTN